MYSNATFATTINPALFDRLIDGRVSCVIETANQYNYEAVEVGRGEDN